MFLIPSFYLNVSTLIYSICNTLTISLSAIKRDFCPFYKSCSLIKSCGKPTITSTTMQERHDNNEIESHNHNEYPLLYKEAEISTSSLGKFLECRKCYILLVTCALVIYLICMPSGLRASGIHIRQIPRAHVTTITCCLD